MELINPGMTVQNAEGPHWLVGFEHDFGNGEHISLTVKVLKTNHPLIQVQREAFDRATELLQVISRAIPQGT